MIPVNPPANVEWTYVGFLDEPRALRKVEDAPPFAARPGNPFVAKPAPEPAPQVGPHRMADASGQVWEHADLAFLTAFIADRNRYISRP